MNDPPWVAREVRFELTQSGRVLCCHAGSDCLETQLNKRSSSALVRCAFLARQMSIQKYHFGSGNDKARPAGRESEEHQDPQK
jgi:hypothetical protein